MPSHPDRVRVNYKCVLCKGTGEVRIYYDSDPVPVTRICGYCKGTGQSIIRQQSTITSLEN